MRRFFASLLLLLGAAAVLPACVSSDLAKSNLSNVRAQSVTLQTSGVTPPADAEATAEALLEATGTVEQILAFGVPTELAASNLGNVRTMRQAIGDAGLDDPAPTAEATAEELARQAGATKALIEGIKPVAGPWWLPVAGLAGAAGAAFTAFKTLRRLWITKHETEDPPSPKPAAAAAPSP